MKKFFALMMSLLLIITTSQASIVTLYGPKCTVTMNSPSNRVIMLSDLKGGIRWWKVLSGGVNVVDNKFVMPETDVEVQPMYEGNQIVVEQTSNGTITPGTTETTEGSNYTFTITPNSGYKIASLKVDGSSVEITGSYTFENVISNHTITAIFSPASSYTVTYNSNGGSGNMDHQTFTEGIAQNLATNTFTRNGYTFNNWNTSQDGIGTSYANGTSYTATGNVTLYAQWTPINYTIGYNLDEGTVSGNPTSYTVESNAINLSNPTKDGYNFTGWTGTGLTETTITVIIPKGSTGDRTYTANWEAVNAAPTTPTVTLSSKTTSSFVVKAVSTDADGDNLIYKLYVDGTLKSTSASTKSGTATTFTVTGLGEYTSYNYYVTVSDGTDTAQSSTASVRTYCSGTGLTCNTTYCSSGVCSECGGDGTYYESCISDNYAIVGAGGSNKCFSCNKTIYYNTSSSSPAYICNVCDKYLCYECMKEGEHRYEVSCYACTDGYACTHKLDYAHYKCNHYSYTTNMSHSYCSHGKTSQHD